MLDFYFCIGEVNCTQERLVVLSRGFLWDDVCGNIE